jgi:doubled CXXCH motif protein
MKRAILLITAAALAGWTVAAWAGDYHRSGTLICSDCHVAHYSQSHAMSTGGSFVPLGTAGPYENLLRNDPNKLCLSCHNNNSVAPDVFGDNTGAFPGTVREAGALNALDGNGLTNDAGYDNINGHTLYSPDMPPGSTGSAYVPGDEGLECVNCHAQHGTANYRNLLNRGIFTGDTVSYAVGSNDLTKDVYETAALSYDVSNVWFNEPNTTKSAYGNWCKACHTEFHGAGGAANMGGLSGGVTSTNATPWKRHPTADVNIGESGASATFISSLSQYAGHANKVKVMDSQGLWTATGTDNTVTPSCFSCHKAHGNQNAFGLIFMSGAGTVTEQGDGGAYRDLCRQCHTEGA